MHDLKFIREYPEVLDEALRKRNMEPHSHLILGADERHRLILSEIQKLQERRNQIAQTMAEHKKQGMDTAPLIEEGSTVKSLIATLEEEEKDLAENLRNYLISLPNIPLEDVPVGKDEHDNKVVRQGGTPKTFSFTPKQHFELGEALGLMDFETASHIAGSRFVILKGALSRLERALSAFMLDLHTSEFGYQEVSPPLLVNEKTMFGTGQLPKFKDDAFQTTHSHFLIPTAEVPVTSFVADKILTEDQLPLRMVAHTPCFRSEAGSAGRDTRGMLRQHQFYKVELVSITHPDQSDAELERMTSAAEEVLKRLELPYRIMLLCTGDMGFNSRKTYDLEVWLPGQEAYREISSCSTCGDFQGRRMNARFRPAGEKTKPQFVHTLNGSGLAVGRTLIGVLENYQQADGSIHIPAVLQPYMGGLTKIEAPHV